MDHNPIKIIVKKDIPLSLEAISTVFYIQIGDFYFPDPEWTDLTYSVLQMWTQKLVSAISHSNHLYFLDGPFSLKITPLRNDEITLYFMHHEKIVREEVSTMRNLYAALLDAYDQLMLFVNNENELGEKASGVLKDIKNGMDLLKGKLSSD